MPTKDLDVVWPSDFGKRNLCDDVTPIGMSFEFPEQLTAYLYNCSTSYTAARVGHNYAGASQKVWTFKTQTIYTPDEARCTRGIRKSTAVNDEPELKIPDLIAIFKSTRLIFITFRSGDNENDSASRLALRSALYAQESELIESLSRHAALMLSAPRELCFTARKHISLIDRVIALISDLLPIVILRKKFINKTMSECMAESMLEAFKSRAEISLFHNGVFFLKGFGSLVCSRDSARFFPENEVWSAMDASYKAGKRRELGAQVISSSGDMQAVKIASMSPCKPAEISAEN